MHPNTLRKKLSGVIAFPVTPFKEDLSLDLPGLHENLTKLLEHPIAAIVVAGGTGELYSLTPAEYTRVVELTALAIEDRVPVIAGVGFGQRLAVEMAQAAEKAGADGILAFPPYYPQAEDEGRVHPLAAPDRDDPVRARARMARLADDLAADAARAHRRRIRRPE